mmetsp:Transcript_13590/g.23946  ORF Transcript_13590/g.23946 Transcript_13590/m.23946 type:complete len:108 (+) Transcript_13590:2351-2674(+)
MGSGRMRCPRVSYFGNSLKLAARLPFRRFFVFSFRFGAGELADTVDALRARCAAASPGHAAAVRSRSANFGCSGWAPGDSDIGTLIGLHLGTRRKVYNLACAAIVLT